MPKRSAGILLFKQQAGDLKLLLVHPGGPFWARKDEGAWSIPKGEYSDTEHPEDAARRELIEELGPGARTVLERELQPLGEIKQKSGKRVTAFAVESDFNIDELSSNLCKLEWPPGSGRFREFPEVDRAQWFSAEEARQKILGSQAPLIDRLLEMTRRQ